MLCAECTNHTDKDIKFVLFSQYFYAIDTERKYGEKNVQRRL